MKVIICGAGQVGWQIGRHCRVRKTTSRLLTTTGSCASRNRNAGCTGPTGFAFSYPDVLTQAGKRWDMIMQRPILEVMVTCQIAHSVFDIPRKIARLRSQSYLNAIYSDIYRRDHMPIDVVISPEREVAETVLKRLSAGSAFDTRHFLMNRRSFWACALMRVVCAYAIASVDRLVLHITQYCTRNSPR